MSKHPAKTRRVRGARGPCRRTRRRSRGFSLLEVEVALLLFGIGLAGLCPLVVMHSRTLESMERSLAPGTAYYLVRWDRTANTSFTAARSVDGLRVLRSGEDQLEIRLTFKHRTATQTYILTARNP
jgi:prepilin-type N-terminal cleavage/methylation domain-containing protein